MSEQDGRSPLVSVIVPVHNGERYLAQCLDSVMSQSLSDVEIILVDDASTDTSPEIMEKYCASDDRFRVVRQPRNRGVSAARNAGLESARGRFIAFVDADDYVDPTMLEHLYRASQDLRVDVMGCGIKVVDENGRFLKTVDFPLGDGVRWERHDMREELHRAFGRKLLWYPVRSLYSRDLLVESGLRFDEGIRKGEDSLFNLQALFFADGVAALRIAPYHYRKHPGSATARPLASESDNIERLGRQVTTFYRSQDFDSRAYNDFFGQILRSDLPTALVRLRRHPDLGREARRLLSSPTVQRAFQSQPLTRLGVPLRVLGLLLLCRLGWVGVLRLVLARRR